MKKTEKQLVKQLDTPELQAIEKSKAKQIRDTFAPMVHMLEDFESRYDGIVSESKKEVTEEVTARARRLRIDIGRVRIETEKVRKAQKEEYLRAGKAIDGVSNIVKWAVTDKENRLKEIENHFEIQEQKRLEALQAEREEALLPYVQDAHERELSRMDDEVWDAYLSAKKKEYEDRIEAERKAEEERIAREKAEAEKRDQIRKENERLKKEIEERKRVEKAEAAKREKEEQKRIAEEEARRKTVEKKEKEERVKREKLEAELRAKEEAERARRERLEAQLRAKEEAERKAREGAEAKVQAELNKGDADKVRDLVAEIEGLKTKYVFKSAKNKKMYREVGALIDGVVQRITGRT